MAYCAKTDLEQRFGTEIAQLLDRNNDSTEDTGVLDTALADTDAEINGYLQGGGYALPLDEVPDLVKAIACDIARYRLWDDRAPEEVRKRYESAISRLRDIARGIIKLPLSDGTAVAQTGGQPDYHEVERVFTADTLSGFVGS
jgi:phage gp36-like protein